MGLVLALDWYPPTVFLAVNRLLQALRICNPRSVPTRDQTVVAIDKPIQDFYFADGNVVFLVSLILSYWFI